MAMNAEKSKKLDLLMGRLYTLGAPKFLLYSISLLALNPAIEIFTEAYGFVELFSGEAWTSRCMRNSHVKTASFDIRYGDPDRNPLKQDHMDLCTSAGFSLALLTILNCRWDHFLVVVGLVCSSFVTVSAGTHQRAPWSPFGNLNALFVETGNLLASRVCALILVISCMNGCWILEQPRSTQLMWLPRVRSTFRLLPEVFESSWWMALYGGLTPKRHIAFSNAKTIQILDLGKLLKEVRQRLSKHGYQSTRSYKSKGRKVFSGTRFLKQTQTYPPRFARRVAKYYDRFCTQRVGHCPKEIDPAPEAALAAKRPTAKSKGKSKGNSKGSTTPPPPSRPVATPARKGAVASEEVPTPPQGASGNPAPQKRLRGKVPDDAKDREIAELKKASAKMQAQLEAMMSTHDSSQGDTGSAPAAPSGEGLSQEAKMAKLRRVCEKKPSGKCKVPEDIHLKWKNNNGDDRKDLLELLETSDWDKDTFVAKVQRSVAKTNKLTRTKKRAWHTEESMMKKLDWSKSYIKNVVAYCRKPGHEKLVRKDRYNKKLDKFLVVVEERDSEVSDLEECERHDAVQDSEKPVNFQLKAKGSMEPPDVGATSETDVSEEEEEAKQTNGPKQEYDRFKTFANSLLGRSAKISELIADLEASMEASQKGPETSEGKRVARLVSNLEEATATLDAEHNKCECVKAQVSKLAKLKDNSDPAAAKMITQIDERVSETTISCSKITAIESAAKTMVRNLKKVVKEEK
ncbi:unnamed protein product [Cladocopium goreaui]|uniref:Uncharacterized protein n=1 Tax=Cladocopium goreaui TaxID=2562237 RepID=A0A9P1DLK6_9DINO|nr:unnamed protein product [Cladocopium goreaui]